jgi:hypothetical protein
MGDYLFDTHSKSVHPDVWKLFEFKVRELKSVPVLIEWDDDIPSFGMLERELLLAKSVWSQAHSRKGADEKSSLL